VANLDEGAVLGGRYQITGRVMASSQQDQVLNGLDQVLNREVLILVASRENASQAAQSARQLATGERASSIQILDLGLSNDRTYLVAPGNSDVEALLALLTNEDVYVEPFFTEALGTELFGESRSHTPQTFDDDAEYYAELHDELEEEQDETTKRPEFLNKLSDRIDNWLQEDTNETPVAPGRPDDTSGKAGAGTATGIGAAAGAGAAAASASKHRDDADETDESTDSKMEQTEQPEPTRSKLPILDDEPDDAEVDEPVQPAQPQQPTPPQVPVEPEPEEETPEERTQIVPPITQEPITEGQPRVTAAAAQQPSPDQPANQRSKQRAAPLIPPPAPDEPTAEEGYAIQYTDEPQRSTLGRWLAGLLLIAVLVGAVVIGFQFLGSPEEEEQPPVAEEPSEEPPAEEEESEEPEEETEDLPAPVPASVERVVPDAPELSNEYESDLPAIVDGNQATAWHTLTFTSPQFGGFASNLALVVELEEKAPISEISIAQNQGSGGAFTVAVSNEPDPTGGVTLTDGSFTGPEYTVDAHNEDGEPIEARYVIINFTELPTLSNTNSPDRPYGLRISEIDVN
ncbi:MAG: hypothetical protein L0H42_05680, partial [Yaniella sp.]|uniref:discoidin domain-containing protein n=1 Tax=Yaniella sp. TaxID=2773929 RepID=UPI00264702C9